MTLHEIASSRCCFSSGGGSERVAGTPGKFRSRWLIPAAFALSTLSTLSTVTTGCARSRGPLFDRPAHELVWPAPPAEPRIRYVGALRHSADLNPGRTFFEGLSEAILGTKAPSPLYGPRSVVCTRDGQRVWIADPGGRCLHLFDLEHRTYRKVSSAGGSPLLGPVGVSLGPDRSIYVCDAEATAIHQLDDRDGSLRQTLRLSSDLGRPVDAWFDVETNELYVVDTVAHDIKVLSPEGSMIRVLGTRGVAPGLFNFPTGIDGDGEWLWITDSGNHRVQALARDGTPMLTLGQAGDAPGDLALPKGVAVDPAGHVHVVDARFENVQIFDRQGRLLLYYGEEGIGYGAFWLPADLFIEPSGRLWVCDTYNRRVQVFELVKTISP